MARHPPSAALAPFIAYYWRVRWDLTGGQPHVQETLPHPNTYLVFEDRRLMLSGVSTTKFARTLAGQGSVFGVKFRPGGLRPFLNAPVASVTDQVIAAADIFGDEAGTLEARLIDCRTEEDMVGACEAFLLGRTPRADGQMVLADQLVDRILRQPEIKTVEDLALQSGLGKRSLQRLFREYAGISPKWVIQRYRLHELVERLESGERLHWPDLALELGYCDQAHLINDFRSVTGYSPADYQRR